MIEYEDFSLKIEPKRGETYPTIVLRSPAGEGRSSFRLPFEPGDLGDILINLAWTTRRSGPELRRRLTPPDTGVGPQRIGEQLFNALFSGPVRSLLDRSLGMIHGSQYGLRIKIHIDPEEPSLAQLASLPWEFLYRRETRDFLNLSRFTPVLRYLDVQRPYTPLPLSPPLRILVVISDPAGHAQLDLDRERAQIEASWAQQEDVQVEFMEQASIMALQDRLAERPYHVLHYMGHGDFDEQTGQGVLVLEDESGQGALVDGSTLAVLLRDVPTMRLVFLNACETARLTKEQGLDPFSGVAAAMVMAGIPAVVAMQFPISDSAAITFSQKFYPLLARGEPVDAAVAEGRRAIRLAEARTMEWGTPVLFMRAPQGIIFQVSERQSSKPPPKIPDLPEEVDEEVEQRLVKLYTRGLSAFWLEEWARAAQSFQAIVDVRPGYEDAAEKLAESKRQANLADLYVRAQAAHDAGDWAGALAALTALTTEEADYRDAAAMLEAVCRKKQLAELYSEAERLHGAQQWQAVVNVFGQIHTMQPDYADPAGLLSTAEQEVTGQNRQAELDSLYSRALRGLGARRWQESRQLLGQVDEMEPGYRETERLLARLDEEIQREEQERQRQEQAASLYEQAQGLAQARQWRQVLANMDRIQALDAEFADPGGIAARAREEVAREEGEALRQSELAALYAEAVRLVRAGQYQEALEQWGQVRALDPRYPDRKKVQATARSKLAALAKGTPPKRGWPGWAIAAIAGIALVVIVAGVVLRGCAPGTSAPDVTKMVAPSIVIATTAATKSSPAAPTLTQIVEPVATEEPVTPGQASFDQGVSLLGQGDYAGAITQFDQALTEGYQTAELYAERGRACHQLHWETGGCELDRCIADLTEAIQLDSQTGWYWLYRGICQADLGNYQAALSDQGHATELEPKNAAAFAERAQVHATMESWDLAIDDWTKAIEIGPQNADYWTRRGWSYFWQGTNAPALDDFEQALELDPEDAMAYWGRGHVHRDQGEHQLAVDDYGKAIEFYPDNCQIYVDRGWQYFEQLGDTSSALSDFDKAIEAEPSNSGCLFQRGLAYERLGREAEARADFEAYLELTGGDRTAEWFIHIRDWMVAHPE